MGHLNFPQPFINLLSMEVTSRIIDNITLETVDNTVNVFLNLLQLIYSPKMRFFPLSGT